MREGGGRGVQCREHLQLQPGIGDMILAAHDVGHAHVDIVDHARQHIEPAAVGAADHRIGLEPGIEMLGPAHKVIPFDHRIMVEPEAPMRRDPVRLQCGTLGVGQLERGTVVDRRQTASSQDLALEIELLRTLIGRIDPPRRAQIVEASFVESEPVRLAYRVVGGEAEPGEIGVDALGEGLGRSRQIGVVQPQQEAPAGLARPQPVMERGADIADMDAPGGRGSETGCDRGHGRPLGQTDCGRTAARMCRNGYRTAATERRNPDRAFHSAAKKLRAAQGSLAGEKA